MRLERIAVEKPEIIRVEALDGDSFGITLESGHTILLELGEKINEPAYAALIESGDFCKPYTDGERLCWPGGTALTGKEILDMLLSHGKARQNQGRRIE